MYEFESDADYFRIIRYQNSLTCFTITGIIDSHVSSLTRPELYPFNIIQRTKAQLNHLFFPFIQLV